MKKPIRVNSVQHLDTGVSISTLLPSSGMVVFMNKPYIA